MLSLQNIYQSSINRYLSHHVVMSSSAKVDIYKESFEFTYYHPGVRLAVDVDIYVGAKNVGHFSWPAKFGLCSL